MTRNNLDEHLIWLLRNAGVSRPNLATQHASSRGTTDQTPVNGALQGDSFDQGTDMRPKTGLEPQRVPALVAKQRQLLTPASVPPSGRFGQSYSQFLKNSR